MYKLIPRSNGMTASDDFANIVRNMLNNSLVDYWDNQSSASSFASDKLMSYRGGLCISKDKQGMTLSRDLPGYGKDNLEVSLCNDMITFIGKRENQKFSYSYKIDTKIYNVEEIKVTYRDGVLSAWVPKYPEAEPRNLEISD